MQREDGSWLIDGSVSTDDLRELLGLAQLPNEEDHDFRTAAGMVMAHFGRIPQPGEHFDWSGFRFEVVDLDGPRIDKLLVARVPRDRDRMSGDGDHRARPSCCSARSTAHAGEDITLGDFLDPLGERAFGFLILILALPNFIPVPIGVGGVMGVLVVLVGVQMLLGFEHPWLPEALRRRGIQRNSVERFVARLTPVLRWLERLCRPRLEVLTRHPAHRISGFLLVLIGIALALPIPFTNYLFGLLLVVFAVALIERDGIALVDRMDRERRRRDRAADAEPRGDRRDAQLLLIAPIVALSQPSLSRSSRAMRSVSVRIPCRMRSSR